MDLSTARPKFEKIIEHLRAELTGIRTNRVSPAIVENVLLVAYEGSPGQLLRELAAITVPEARQLLVEPWDKSIIKQIEAALEKTSLDFSISNEGDQLRLTMPIMTEEIRAQVKKLLHDKLEASRVALRKQRDSLKDEINTQEKAKEISEDDKFRQIKELDELTKEYSEKINDLGDKKEGEISV